MAKDTCRLPSPLDRQFAQSNGSNEFIIANLRGLYEVRTGDTINSVEEYITKLLPFKNKLVQEDKKAIDNILNCRTNASEATVTKLLKKDFTNAEIQELTDLIFSNFTDIINISATNPTGELKDWIDDMNSKGKYISRPALIKKIGVDNILLKLVNSINAQYYTPTKSTYMNPLLGKLLEGNHLDTFLWLARKEIYAREGIKFGRKIKYVVEFKNDETLEADYKVEDSVKDGWMREMEKESPFKNIGQEVRSYLGRQVLFHPQKVGVKVKSPKTGNIRTVYVEAPQTSKNGFRKMHSPVELHKTLQNMLTGCRDQAHMLDIISRAAKDDVNMQHIYNDLVADPQLAGAFYRDFHKTKCNYTKAYINKAKRIIFQVMQSNVKKLSYYHYSNGFTSETPLDNTIFERVDDEIIISGTKLDVFANYLNENIGGNSFENTTIQSSTITAERGSDDFTRQSYLAAKDIVETISDVLSLGLTKDQIESLVANKVNMKSFLADAKALANDKWTKAGTALSKASPIFKDRITAMLNNVNDSATSSTKAVRIDDSTYFTDIVSSKAATMIDIVKSFANDAKYALSLDDSAEQERRLEEVVASLRSWIKSNYGCSSEYFATNPDGSFKGFYNRWIAELYNTTVESLKDLDSFIYHFNYDRAMLFDGILAEDFSAELDLKSFITNYFSIDTEVSSGWARYPIFTTGDSLALKFITARKYGYNTLITRFTEVAKQEIQRMQLEAQIKEDLNAGEIKYEVKDIASLANKSTSKDSEVTGNFIYLKFLNNYKNEIRTALKNGTINDVLQNILKKELFTEYTEQFANQVVGKESFVDNEDGTYAGFPNFYALNPKNMFEDTPANGLMMYYLNTKLAYIYQYQFLGANPAPYGLSTAMQKRYKAYNAPGTPMDVWAKDYKGNYYVKTEDGKPVSQKVKYFKDTHLNAEETDPAFMKALALHWGKQALGEEAKNKSEEEIIKEGKKDSRYKKYKDNDATDGQGFRVLESYRRVMGMAHQWTPEMEEAFDTIQKLRKDSWDRASNEFFNRNYDALSTEDQYKARMKATLDATEIDEINDLGTVFQPIKPHTSTVERVATAAGDILLVPVEHKYAEALIIPELFPENSFRRMLGVEMEEGGIDLSCSEQCVKVGSFGAAKMTESIALKNNEAFKSSPETFAADFKAGYTHNIDYADYTIQTNVPEHINASQLFGTQLRKHVFDAIQLLQAYNYGGVDAVKVHGETLHFDTSNGGKAFLKFYNALICENMNSDLIDLTKKLSTTDKLSDLLTELKGNDFNSSIEDAMRFSVTEDGKFNNPICEPSGMYDIESILTSIFKREVNKQHINGGSCVQVSDYGISNFGTELKVHTEGDNITYVDCAMAWDLSWTDAQGNKVPLKFSDYCDADGTLLVRGQKVKELLLKVLTEKELFSKVSEEEFAKDWGFSKLEKFIKDNEIFTLLSSDLSELVKTKIEEDYEGILDLVAYRIPTEREYSVINLRVKKFLPKVLGGIIMVPSQYVTVAGFDFDIDKLYYFRKEFKQKKELTPNEVTKVWNDIYGLKEDAETGEISTANATEIYRKLKGAATEAMDRYRALLPEESYGNNTLGTKDEAAELKALLGLTEEETESPLPEEFLPKKRLYEYWDEAGLAEETGMTYSEYFNKYLSDHKSKYLTFDEYDYNKDVTDNSVVARNNELIKCIQSRLTSPDTFDARYTPGGFTNAIRDADVLKAILFTNRFSTLEEAERFADTATKAELAALDPDRDVTNVLTTAEYNARNRVASKVIGIMANHNTNAVYSKAMGRLELRSGIPIFGYTLQDLNNSNTGRNYMLTLAELLASSVDAVKTPVLNFLNINSYTANVSALLARLGLSTEEIGLFLNQPIIKEVCEDAANAGDSSITRAIRRVGKKYFKDTSLKGEYEGSLINKTDLFDSLVDAKKESFKLESNARQLNVLNAFLSISNQAQALSDFIAKTKYTAANSIENTMGGMIALIYDNKAANEQETSINKHLVMSFEGFSSASAIEQANELMSPVLVDESRTLENMQDDSYKKFLDSTPFAFEQMVHDAVRAYIDKVCKYFPYTTQMYKQIYDAIYGNITFGTMDKDIVNAINSQLPVFILSILQNSMFNPDQVNGEFTNKEYYTIEFPKQLRDFLKDRETLKEAQHKQAEFNALKEKYSFLEGTTLEGILDNDLLDKLMVEEYSVVSDDINVLEDEGIRFNITIEEDGQFDKDVKNSLITAWDSLIADKEAKVNDATKSLAHALFMYNFHTRGYEVGRNAFSNITPLSLKDTLYVNAYMSYNEFYEKLVEGNISDVNFHKFIPLFYANNYSNNKLVKNVYTKLKVGPLNDPNLPTGRVVAEFGQPVRIIFDGGEKQNYSEISLPKSKKAGLVDSKGRPIKRAVVTAFKVVDRYSTPRLFVLEPNASTDYYLFADSQYNIRNLSSRVSYVEVPLRGIKNTTVDYSMQDMGLNAVDPTSADISSTTVEPYADESINEPVNEEDMEAIQQAAKKLANKAQENRKKLNDC